MVLHDEKVQDVLAGVFVGNVFLAGMTVLYYATRLF
jgi:hypothetical protein